MGSADAPTRGRVVMLVDNGVDGDSRVQKIARSAAEAGWDVVLLGRALYPRSWHLGKAEVRILSMEETLARRRHEFRRTWFRSPFAYPPSGVADRRTSAMQAWKASELRTWLALPRAVRQRGVLAVTFMDALPSKADAGRLLARLAADAGPHFRRIVTFSAHGILAAPGGELG